MAPLAVLTLALLAAASAARNDDLVAAGVSSADAGKIEMMSMMADALPHDDSPKPTQAMQDKIDQAGPLVYSAYQQIKDAEESVDSATQQMQVGLKTSSSAQNIAQAEALVQRAATKLDEGKKLAMQAKSDFMKSADPLGDEPHPPQDWGNVLMMVQRSSTRMKTLKGNIEDAKSQAQQNGISLIDVASEKVTVVQDSWSDNREKGLMDFLSHY